MWPAVADLRKPAPLRVLHWTRAAQGFHDRAAAAWMTAMWYTIQMNTEAFGRVLWDIPAHERDRLDTRFVIGRVLGYGSVPQMLLAKRAYGADAVRSAASGMKQGALSPRPRVY